MSRPAGGVFLSFWTPESIRAVVSGTYRARPGTSGITGGVGIDTRTLKPGQVFAAFKGERTDGHAYLHEARAKGSTLALIERGASIEEPYPEGMTLIEVESTRPALGALAQAYRKTLASTRVIGVTGSNGKTTTVRLIDHVLGSKLRGSASIKSFNNDIGLPLTLLAARPNDQYVVCEMGMSSPGEIARLAWIASPDIGVITSVGRAHVGFFESVSDIAREKASILHGLSPKGVGVISAHAEALAPFLPPGVPLIRFGTTEDADVRLSEIESGPEGVRFKAASGQAYRVPLLGAHNAHNAAAAIAVARRLGMTEPEIATALASARGPEMRLARETIGGIELINDAYNANPDSVLAALGVLSALGPTAKRRVLVLGDMLELGALGPGEHRAMGETLAGRIRAGEGPDFVVLVGDLAALAADPVRAELGNKGVLLEPTAGDGRSIAERLVPGDLVLLKGSRSVGLERVASALADTLSDPAPAGTGSP